MAKHQQFILGIIVQKVSGSLISLGLNLPYRTAALFIAGDKKPFTNTYGSKYVHWVVSRYFCRENNIQVNDFP